MGILKAREQTEQTDPDLVRAVAALTDAEWHALVDEARSESLVPLAHLVLEGLADSLDSLTAALGDRVVLDDIGRRAVTRDTARRLFAEHAERQAAKARAKAERAARAKARLAAQADANRATLRGGVPARSGSALADIRGGQS